MPTWFRGGLQQWHSTAQPWPDASALSFFASLVTGPTITTNPDWVTLQDLLDANPGRPLVTAGKNLALTGRFVQWSTTNDEFLFAFSDSHQFDGVAAGIDVAGVLLHEQNDSVPANSTIWAFDDSPGQTQGGSIRWGTQGVNNIFLKAKPNMALQGAGGQSSILAQNAGADTWGSRDLAHSLVLQASPPRNPDWQTVQDAISAGVVFATLTGPNEANSPRLTPAQRRVATYSSPSLIHQISQGSTVTFDGAQFSAGEVVVAVMSYLISGTDVLNARIWNWDLQTAHTLALNQSIVYGNVAAADQNTYSNVIV